MKIIPSSASAYCKNNESKSIDPTFLQTASYFTFKERGNSFQYFLCKVFSFPKYLLRAVLCYCKKLKWWSHKVSQKASLQL